MKRAGSTSLRSMDEPDGGPDSAVREWLWRLFAVGAGLAVVSAAVIPSDVGGLMLSMVRWLGVIVLFTVVYSYVTSLEPD